MNISKWVLLVFSDGGKTVILKILYLMLCFGFKILKLK
jgi:hypothetical protein